MIPHRLLSASLVALPLVAATAPASAHPVEGQGLAGFLRHLVQGPDHLLLAVACVGGAVWLLRRLAARRPDSPA